MKRTVFISHSSKDKATAETVCRFLEAQGISCWIAPRDVTPGKNYGAAIVDAIDGCKVFVLILSGESNQSGQVVREVERAANANSVIIPLRVESVQPSRDLEFYVSSSHWLDATERPLEKHLGALVDAIRNWHTPSTPQEKSAAPDISLPVASAAQQWRSALIIGGVVIAIALCALAVFFAMRSSRKKEPAAPVAVGSIPLSSPSARFPNRSGRRALAAEPVVVASASAQPATSITETNASPPLTASTPAESVAPEPAPAIERVIASSQLKPTMYIGALKRYNPELAFDGDEKTAWVPNGSGPGEWIQVHFKTPSTISSVSVFGGDGVDFARYQTNNRVRELRMSFPNGFTRVFELEDKMQFQRFDLPKHPLLHSIEFEIVSVYRGTKYDTTPISEIAFNRSD